MASAKSKTPAARKRAPGPSSRSRSSSKAAGNTDGQASDEVANVNKQETALHHGGSLAQRTGAEGTGPGPDATGEITSSAPAGTKEAGRASSPSGDEKPVTGKGKGKTTAQAPVGKVPVRGLPESESDIPEEGFKAKESIDDLDAGSSILKLADEVQIHTPIAGGARKVFHGRTSKEAFASLNQFAQGEHELLPGALGDTTDEAEKSRQAAAAQFDKDALERSRQDLKARNIEAD